MKRAMFVGMALMALMAVWCVAGYAQDAPPPPAAGMPAVGAPPPPPAGGPAGPGRAGAGGDARRAEQMAARMAEYGKAVAAQAPAIAVNDKYVFVVFAGTLYQYSVDGLKLVGSAQMMPRGMGQGGPGGQGRDGRPGRGGGEKAGGPVGGAAPKAGDAAAPKAADGPPRPPAPN
jgi:hypothetical protein